MATGDLSSFAAALENVRDAFRAAARERLALIRELAAVDVTGAGAAAEADRRALVEALLRREAADADEAAALEDRVRRSVAEARAAATARERLGGVDAVQDLSARIDRTWALALNRADDLAGWLRGRADPPLSAAFTAYVQALRGLHDLGPDPAPSAVDGAVTRFADALQRLEDAAGR